jgi:hypothetical protein
MAVYKVIQDIEAEDKLLGPLSLKGLVYAGIAGISAYLEFRLLFVGSPVKYLFMLLFAFPLVLFGVLASPLGREQPTEVWLLSRIRFFLKPRSRIWDQEGMSELVTVTAPKKDEVRLTKDLSPTEVKSRLKTLASTLDTRGWAIKNVDVNLSDTETAADVVAPESDRLVSGAIVPRQMQVVDVHAADDIMDEKHNPTAQKFDALMKEADADRKQGLLDRLKDIVDIDEVVPKKGRRKKTTKDLPATKAALAKLHKRKKVEPEAKGPGQEEDMSKRLATARASFAKEHESDSKTGHKILPDSTPAAVPRPTAPPEVTANRQTVNMELAQSGNDISVASIAKLANRPPVIEQTGPNEVSISLH